MGPFKSPPREPRDQTWYNFPWKALSMASRLRVQWGRPETPTTWRRIVDYLHRSGFPAFDAEKLRVAVLDFEERPQVLGDRHAGGGDRALRPTSSSRETPPPKTRDDVDASWKDAWRQEFPDEPWPGASEAIAILQRKVRQK